MTARIVRIVALALAALAIAACSDNRKDLLAPQGPEKMIIPPGTITPFQPRLPNPGDFMQISAGGNHTCARKYSGDVLCWGAEGEAGYGQVVATPTVEYTGASQIAVGNAHACAINNFGAAFCWGGGEEGQLGIQLGAMIGYSSGPVLGPRDPNNYYATLAPLSFTSIYAGGNSTCGLTSSGVYCWGSIGDYTNQGFMSVPNLVVVPGGGSYNGFTNLAVGNGHACGLAAGQQVLCWGADLYGQAGSDPLTAFYYPGTKAVMFAMNTGVPDGLASRIAAQGDFTCVDIPSSTVECFGLDYDGELGDATRTPTAVPQAITGNGLALHGVGTGQRHACALDVNNEAWCWGYNYWGMVGNGTWSYYTTSAQKVLGVSTGYQTFGATVKFRALAAGAEHTCGISTDNHIYCWGHNDLRQLGTTLIGANGQPLAGGWVPAPVLVM